MPDDLTPPHPLHVSAQENICRDTVEAWIWYCDIHDSHGNADSEEEAKAVAAAHRDFHQDETDDDDEGCDLVVWLRTGHERAD